MDMPAGGVKLLIPVLLFSVMLDFVMAVVLALSLKDGPLTGLLVLVSGLPTLAVIAFVIPVRYEIWSQKLSIVFLFGRHWDIPFSTIESVAEAKRWRPYASRGVRFATSPAQAIAVNRKNPRTLGRPNIVISPRDRSVFLPRLQQALADNPEAS